MGDSDLKWTFARQHMLRSALGFVRLFWSNPRWAVTLLKARLNFFRTRQLSQPLASPDGFVIESTNELVSYWSFFVERECWASQWVRPFRTDAKPVVIDVGANAGLFTHWLWTLRPTAQFIVFEPLPEMAAKIAAWKTKTGARLSLHNQAVANYCGEATFYASRNNDTTASLKPENHEGELTFKVPVATLDSAIPADPVFLLKIDVEGTEAAVLAGAGQTLARCRFLIVECHTEAALAKIQQQLGHAWVSQRVGASDYFFSRQ